MSATDSNPTNPIVELNTGILRDMLVVIDKLDEKPNGQTIKEAMEASGYDDINHGRLYPALDRLVDQGLVKKGEINRRSNYYVLSESGEERLSNYREFVEE